MTRTRASSASLEFDRPLLEATEIAGRIHDRLAAGAWPEGLEWGEVGDMAETVRGLRAVSDRMFAEKSAGPTSSMARMAAGIARGQAPTSRWGTMASS